MEQIKKDLIKLQKTVIKLGMQVRKDSTNEKYNYSSLPEIKANFDRAITEANLNIGVILEDIIVSDNVSKAKYSIFNDDSSIDVLIPLDIKVNNYNDPNQAIGGALTYSKKLLFKMLLGTCDVDDIKHDPDTKDTAPLSKTKTPAPKKPKKATANTELKITNPIVGVKSLNNGQPAQVILETPQKAAPDPVASPKPVFEEVVQNSTSENINYFYNFVKSLVEASTSPELKDVFGDFKKTDVFKKVSDVLSESKVTSIDSVKQLDLTKSLEFFNRIKVIDGLNVDSSGNIILKTVGGQN